MIPYLEYYQDRHEKNDDNTADEAYGLKTRTPGFLALSFAHNKFLMIKKKRDADFEINRARKHYAALGGCQMFWLLLTEGISV